MKKLIPIILLMLVSCAAIADGSYIQKSSTISQTPGAGMIQVVQMDITDGANGISSTSDTITVGKAGAYFVMAAPQVSHNSAGCYDLWLSVNGSNVDNSNVRLCHNSTHYQTDVIVSQGINCLAKGDALQLKQSASMNGIGTEAIHPIGEPLIPAIIFSMFRIGQCG